MIGFPWSRVSGNRACQTPLPPGTHRCPTPDRLCARSGADVGACEQLVDGVPKRARLDGKLTKDLARPLEQRTIAANVREVEVGHAGLARAEERTAAAQVEVDL